MRSDGPALLPVFRSQHQAELLMWLLHPEEEPCSSSRVFGRRPKVVTTQSSRPVRAQAVATLTAPNAPEPTHRRAARLGTRRPGFTVPDRGRMRPEVWQAWREAHAPDEERP